MIIKDLKCLYCNSKDFFILNDIDNKECFGLVSGNFDKSKFNFKEDNTIPLNLYQCKKCKNLVFRVIE